jgi:hypothetical protein
MNTASVWYPNYNKYWTLPLYGILTTTNTKHCLCVVSLLQTKSSRNTHFVCFCLLYSPAGVSFLSVQEQSANIFGLRFPLILFSISEMS